MTSVCILNPTLLVRRPIAELCGVLVKNGYKVGLLTPNKSSYDKKEHHLFNLKDVTVLGFTYLNAPGEFEWPVPGFDYLRKLKQAADRYDVFHLWTHFYLHILIAVFYLKVIRKKRIILTMDTLPGESFKFKSIYDRLFWIYNRTIGKWIINRADALTVYGESLRKIILHNLRPKSARNIRMLL